MLRGTPTPRSTKSTVASFYKLETYLKITYAVIYQYCYYFKKGLRINQKCWNFYSNIVQSDQKNSLFANFVMRGGDFTIKTITYSMEIIVRNI